MNYYIQGNKEKADQIKTAFGKYVSTQEMAEYDFSQEEYLFYTGQEERGTFVYAAWSDSVIAEIIKTHPDYKELELPVEPKFKVGDWIVATGKCVYLITKIDEFTVILVDVMGDKYEFGADLLNDATLWTVNDAKDGDVLATDNIICIFRKLGKDGYYIISPCVYTVKDGLEIISDENDTIGSYGFKPATKEDRELLFRKMKEVGYEWDADKKELRKIQPHYDIANFHAGMPVLVRDYNNSQWSYVQFSHLIAERNVGECEFKFNACGIPYIQCIPFNDDTKHLLGTTDPCDEQYINW